MIVSGNCVKNLHSFPQYQKYVNVKQNRNYLFDTYIKRTMTYCIIIVAPSVQKG